MQVQLTIIAFMTNMNLYKFIGAILVLGAITYVGVTFPQTSIFVGSAVGTTFNTAKVAAINFSPATGTATTTSILNGDASDRIITDSFAECNTLGSSFTAYTGAALANLIFTAATTSTSAPASVTNTQLALNVNISTTTTNIAYVATSTFTNIQPRIWATGTYLTFVSNATNTAACNVGVHYLAT